MKVNACSLVAAAVIGALTLFFGYWAAIEVSHNTGTAAAQPPQLHGEPASHPADANGDGHLSSEEVKSAADSNGDGKITEQEHEDMFNLMDLGLINLGQVPPSTSPGVDAGQSVAEASAFHLAQIANSVYTLDVAGFTVADLDKDTGDYKVISASIHNPANGIKMAVWNHTVNGNVVLALKGTDFLRVSDLKDDLALATGAWSPSKASDMQQKAKELIQQFGVNMVTGHSLGGYMAEILATNEGLPGIAFCAPGTNGPITKLGGKVTPGFHNINFEHDALGNVFPGYYTHVQWSVYLPNPPGRKPAHSIAYMIGYFEKQPLITNKNVLEYTSSYMTGYYLPATGWKGVDVSRVLQFIHTANVDAY
jgi:hypothetical protein